MRKLFLVFLLASLPAAYALPRPQQNQQNQAAKRGPGLNQRRMVMVDSVISFYVTRFPKQVDVSDETFVKILPFLRQFVQDRFDITMRRDRALSQLRQTLQRSNATEDELKRVAHDFDAAEKDIQANQEKFLANVDSLLTPKQQAGLRVFQVQIDNQMRQMLNVIQMGNRPAISTQRANPPD